MKSVLEGCANATSHLFIVIHSIDGAGLRNSRSIDYLGELSALPCVHLICSMDHIRGNLLFSSSALSHFQFVYHDATTFAPYYYEIMFMSQGSQAGKVRSSSGLGYVLSSLTSNHLKILMLLSRETSGSKEGLTFTGLYELCLSEMLVSSEKSLQLILKEMEDHQLVKRLSAGNNPQESYVCLVSPRELSKFCDIWCVCWIERWDGEGSNGKKRDDGII